MPRLNELLEDRIKIKKGSELGAERVFKVVEELIPLLIDDHDPWPPSLDSIEALLNDPRDELFIAYCNNIPVGMCTVTFENRVQGLRGWLHDVVVRESHRKYGIGKKLVIAAAEYVELMKVNSFTLISENFREVAHRLYHNLGFESESLLYFELRPPLLDKEE